ncbi:hypothetical protein EUX98_g2130 [Antrodiella citrinella]|uniref:Ricin B lectin domain-containing protein n=1 Tax=Antrodiella citrinella TaxID=2447956 RepID=A0A4S4MZS6_9APHY|nr:hypothetical protein EUX98_g2130 [Antrodiella citrinella]
MSTSNTNKLEDGMYAIVNHQNDSLVFRHPIEDMSGLPKPVYVLPSSTQPIGLWQLQQKSEGKYVLKALNAPTGLWARGDSNKKVYAMLQGWEHKAVEWHITEVMTVQGRKGYIIETEDNGKQVGWTTAGERGPNGVQIGVRPLPTTFSIPPRYFPDDVFEIVRVEE